jgi:SynChlorMet cassette radical SAM/SPASM protein ScmF
MSMAERQLQLPEGVPPLNSYYVYLTGGCNLACKHCWIAPSFQPHGDTGGHLDYKLFEMAIEEGLLLGLRHVKLTGGEPLLHPDFIRMVDLLREKELGLTIETNGVLMTEKLAHYLKEKSTLGSISVSLDGVNPETHDTFRGVKGSFEKTCQAVRYLVAVGIRPQMIMSIHEGNVDEIEPLVRLVEQMGAGSVKFNLIQPSGRGSIMIQRIQALTIQQLIEIGSWVEHELSKRVSIPLIYTWPLAFHSIGRLLKAQRQKCAILNILGILPEGHLAMCGIGTQESDLVYGQLGKDTLSEIWKNHHVLTDLRHDFVEQLEGICRQCVVRNECMGTCIAESYHVSHRLTAAYWFCEQADELGLFPFSRKNYDSSAVGEI